MLEKKAIRQPIWIVAEIARKRRIGTLQRSNVQANRFTISGLRHRKAELDDAASNGVG
jgi:hypothetical protein